jgi:D-glucosaminate-6-phosphate ammonia-lyase
MLSRRTILKQLSSLPVVGGLAAGSLLAGKEASGQSVTQRDYYKELGLRTFINAAGTYTSLTGCLMPKEVVDAYTYATNEYVGLNELQDAVGKKIAEMIGCEAAMVTAGAASAMTLGTAGVLTGTDDDKAKRIPNDLTGMKDEVIVQEKHVIGYSHAIKNCGIKLVVVKTRKELINAINDKTAMLYFTNFANNDGPVQDREFAQIGKQYGIPSLNDAAADTPPKKRLSVYIDMGFDLVTFSGGKGIRGPQSAGLLFGRKDLIEAARFNAPPNGDRIGRGMKVNKEEIVAMWIALETYMKMDLDKEWRRWQKQINLIEDAASSVDGVSTKNYVPEINNHVPSLDVVWDSSKISMSGSDFQNALREGSPSIAVARPAEHSVNITTWMMVPGQEQVVAKRVKEELNRARA